MKDKDIYDLLNEIDINEEDLEVEEMETNDIEKMKVLNNVKGKIKSSNKNKKTKKGIAIASILGITVISSAVVYNSDSILASDIPIIKNIFNILGYNKGFSENANTINIYDENKNGSITIEEVLFDGKNIFLTYKVETEEDMDTILSLWPDMQVINKDTNKYIGCFGRGQQDEKINNNTFIGTAQFQLDEQATNIGINLTFKDLEYALFDKEYFKENDYDYNFEHATIKKLKGKWKFNLETKALDNKSYNINKTSKEEDTNLTINFDNIRISPVTSEIDISYSLNDISKEYEILKNEFHRFSVELKIKDDLGNEYNNISGSSRGTKDFIKGTVIIDKLNEDAKKLYITPYYSVGKNGGQAIINKDGTSETIEYTPIEKIAQLNNREFETIEINLENLR